jgi:hypothetical protein
VQARAEYPESRAWTDDLVADMDDGAAASMDSAQAS